MVGTKLPESFSAKDTFDDQFSSFQMTNELLTMRDTSMTKGRVFSFIEKETDKFSRSNNMQLRFKLSAKMHGSLVENLILTMSSISAEHAIDMKITAEHFHEFIKNKWIENLPNLSESQKKEYTELMENLQVTFDEKAIVTDLKQLRSTHKKRKESLEFANLREICNILLLSNDSATINEVSRLINKDIEMKKQKYGIDCREEYYKNKGLVPKELLSEMESTDTAYSLKESVRAILLFEYNRLSEKDEADFLDGTIDYDVYVERNRKYTDLVLDLW
jgi:hypothetical protein